MRDDHFKQDRIHSSTFGSGVGFGVNRRRTLGPLSVGGGTFLTVRLQPLRRWKSPSCFFLARGKQQRMESLWKKKSDDGKKMVKSRAGCWSVRVSTV